MYRWMDGSTRIYILHALLMRCHILLLDEKVFVKIIAPPPLFLQNLDLPLPLTNNFRPLPPFQLSRSRKQIQVKHCCSALPHTHPISHTFSLHHRKPYSSVFPSIYNTYTSTQQCIPSSTSTSMSPAKTSFSSSTSAITRVSSTGTWATVTSSRTP